MEKVTKSEKGKGKTKARKKKEIQMKRDSFFIFWAVENSQNRKYRVVLRKIIKTGLKKWCQRWCWITWRREIIDVHWDESMITACTHVVNPYKDIVHRRPDSLKWSSRQRIPKVACQHLVLAAVTCGWHCLLHRLKLCPIIKTRTSEICISRPNMKQWFDGASPNVNKKCSFLLTKIEHCVLVSF